VEAGSSWCPDALRIGRRYSGPRGPAPLNAGNHGKPLLSLNVNDVQMMGIDFNIINVLQWTAGGMST